MFKNILSFLLLLTVLLVSCAPKEPQDEEKFLSDFRAEETLENRIKMFENFKETNPESKYLGSMLSRIVRTFSEEKEYAKAADYLNSNVEYATSRIFNSIAWSIFESKENLELGSNLAKVGTDLAREELANISETKPESATIKEWEDSKKNSLAMILDTYGCIVKEEGNIDKAISIFEEAVELTGEQYGEVNENYVSAIISKGDQKKAQQLLEKFISNGTDSDKMKGMLKKTYIKNGNNESDYEEYLSVFEAKAKQKLIDKIKNELKNIAATDFELLDLDGNRVKLSDFKGQKIVLDFWATWCGPCLQSFPAMKEAVTKFKDVKFLFANTWERVEDKKQNAIDFIAKNEYPFHVLMDDKNEVVEKYGVQGIPTKFIIDKDQNIRYESIGFSGKADEMIMELELIFSMID